jgi:murein DD-endopeptidase MepM/ murein hydrolase activator NlpD
MTSTILALISALAISFSIYPAAISLGEPLTIQMSAKEALGEGDLALFRAQLYNTEDKRVSTARFFSTGTDKAGRHLYAAVLTVPTATTPGTMNVRIADTDKSFALEVLPRSFHTETLHLNEASTEARSGTENQAERTAQSEALSAILYTLGSTIYERGTFQFPVESQRRTGNFGDSYAYIYSNGVQSTTLHAGVDYGVPVGTAVRACGRGRVVLAENRIATGWSIVIEHLPGVFSLYYHLDSLSVAVGDLVEKGALIARSGNTGISTGPHLHWAVYVGGENTDPDALVARSLLPQS